MFWHGAPLSRLERLAMASFVAHGHPVELYVYEEPAGVPAGVQIRDAAAILDRSLMFRHRRTGSFAPFADWFRYRVLFERGGIWVDADMVCLRPLDYPHAEIFAWQDERYINNAVLGLPAGHAMAAWLAECCERPNRILPYDDVVTRVRKLTRLLLYGNDRERTRWGEYGPKGLTAAVRHFGLADRALPGWHFYPVAMEDWACLFRATEGRAFDFGESRAVHLWNNMMHEAPGFDKNGRFPPDSPIEQWASRYLKSDA
jgi:hypothetical protein